jgi:glycine/D-amino acid oxidase-like deaminating enzyme
MYCFQVNPFKLTNKFFKKAQDLVSTEMKIAEVSGFKVGKDNTIRGVKLKGDETLLSNRVVITMGAWCSKKLIRSFGIYKVVPHKAASIVMREVETTPQVMFMAYTPKATREREDSEWHPRKDGTLFVCGEDEQVPLPERVSQVSPGPAAIARLKATVEEMAPGYSIRTSVEQACYLPSTRDGLPLIGKIRGIHGLYIATGHSVWGILAAPATGSALAELIVDGQSRSINLSDFDPNREAEPDDD